jgi:uncharacterized protein (TIGR02099 family)
MGKLQYRTPSRRPEDRSINAFPRIVLRLATGAVAILLAAFAALVLWLRYDALPHADRYRDTIVASIERASGMAVKARHLRGGWDGLRPSLTLEGFEIADHRGRTVFALDRADVTLSWWALFALRVRFHDVEFFRPNLELRRGTDGLIYLADKALNRPTADDDGAFSQWLLSQPRLAIHDATLVWRDEMTGAPEVRLTQVEFAMRKHLGHHHAAFSALPPARLAGRIDVRADMTLTRSGSRWHAAGRLFAEGLNTDLAGLRAHLPVPESLRAGVGSLRVWATFADDAVREVIADVNMRDATAELATDSLPLTLASLSGRATYRARPDGFSFATTGLRFRLPGGEEAHPGNFSIDRSAAAGAPPHVDVRADGIDLKIAATLIDYFPVPRDIKGQIGRYAPRGRIADASLSWSGENAAQPKSYAVKGRFEDLAVNPVDAFPGVTGVSGSIEGTEAGGTLQLASRGATFTLERVFRAPLVLSALEIAATWKHAGESFEVAISDAHFANADAEGHLSGTWRTLPGSDRSPGYVDLQGKLSRATATRVADYMPNRLTITRDWLERSIKAGVSDRVTFEVKGDLARFPFGEGADGHFLVEGDVRDGVLKYHPAWPSVDAVQGTFRFENRRLEIRAKRATIFASRASNVSASIEGLGIPSPLLTLDGDIDTSGADSVRFLRESPLVNGPGAFTRAVAVEGPGRLKVHLEYPLAPGAVVRVAGDYEFSGATATVARDLALRDIQGHLMFTEKSVSAPDITGTIFGAPARLAMSTEPDGRVLSTLDARVDAPSLAAFMPASLAAHMSGATDWRAQVLSGRDGTQLTVASDLAGLAVTLPDPLAKEADAARRLEVTVARLGAPGEATVIELAGGVHGRVTHATVDGVEQWNAALGFGSALDDVPERPGLWLYGKLDKFDADAWQALFAPPTHAEAPPEASFGPERASADGERPAGGIELRGLDLALARVRYMGRDFTDLRAKLTRDGRQWAGRLESPKVAGEVTWDPAGKGSLTARFARLAVGQSARPDAPEVVASHPDLPALDITADRFEFRDHWLGALNLKAQPDGDAWRIDHLDIENKDVKFASSGRWRRTADGSLTTLDLKLDAQSLNALLGQFGFGDYLKRGTGKLSGNLAWSGYPYDFALGRLAGRFKVEAHNGQFAKIQSGAGKLLALISLQSLPRRATLDFRDVFSEGFAFDRIQADVNVARGILLTDGLEIAGPAAFVSLSGEVSLPDETQKLTLRVVPEVSEGVAIAAALVGTPVLGLSTLLVSKLLNNPLGNVVAYEYSVTGSWDNPQVTRISAPLAKAAAATP